MGMGAEAGRSSYVPVEVLRTVPDPGAKGVAVWLRALADSAVVRSRDRVRVGARARVRLGLGFGLGFGSGLGLSHRSSNPTRPREPCAISRARRYLLWRARRASQPPQGRSAGPRPPAQRARGAKGRTDARARGHNSVLLETPR